MNFGAAGRRPALLNTKCRNPVTTGLWPVASSGARPLKVSRVANFSGFATEVLRAGQTGKMRKAAQNAHSGGEKWPEAIGEARRSQACRSECVTYPGRFSPGTPSTTPRGPPHRTPQPNASETPKPSLPPNSPDASWPAPDPPGGVAAPSRYAAGTPLRRCNRPANPGPSSTPQSASPDPPHNTAGKAPTYTGSVWRAGADDATPGVWASPTDLCGPRRSTRPPTPANEPGHSRRHLPPPPT